MCVTAHIGVHKSNYTCEWATCNRRGLAQTSRFALISHIRSHTGEKPFICSRPGEWCNIHLFSIPFKVKTKHHQSPCILFYFYFNINNNNNSTPCTHCYPQCNNRYPQQFTLVSLLFLHTHSNILRMRQVLHPLRRTGKTHATTT